MPTGVDDQRPWVAGPVGVAVTASVSASVSAWSQISESRETSGAERQPEFMSRVTRRFEG